MLLHASQAVVLFNCARKKKKKTTCRSELITLINYLSLYQFDCQMSTFEMKTAASTAAAITNI